MRFFDAMGKSLRKPETLTNFRVACRLMVLFLPAICQLVEETCVPGVHAAGNE
jgi:hypothetical protein